MTYEKERGRPERFRVRLPRRCLQVGQVFLSHTQSYKKVYKETLIMKYGYRWKDEKASFQMFLDSSDWKG